MALGRLALKKAKKRRRPPMMTSGGGRWSWLADGADARGNGGPGLRVAAIPFCGAANLNTMTGAIVLAGGDSRRMGLEKAWLDCSGRPLLAHVVDTVSTCVDVVVVVGTPGQPLPALPSAIRRDDPPELAHGGPLVGLVTGLAALAQGGIGRAYCCSSDAALLTKAHVAFILEQLNDKVDAVVPSEQGADGRVYLHPLASGLRVGPALGAGQRLLAEDERAVGRLFDLLPTRQVPSGLLPDARVLLPCNTPEEWSAIAALLCGDLRRH
jgi:molybdenum cofactor guanylyltransferase